MANANGTQEPARGEDEVDQGFVALAEEIDNRHDVFFSDKESQVLDCYQQLEELCLERAILEAHTTKRHEVFPDLSDDQVEEEVKKWRNEFLDSRAGLLLKNSIVQNVMFADPLIKAVHQGLNGNPMERALHPLIDQRDVLSLAYANLFASIDSTASQLTRLRTENLKAAQANQGLTAQILSLVPKTKSKDVENIEDQEIRERLQELRREMRESRRQYRIIKSTVSAAVAASGVDWVENQELQELVLDDEEQ